MGKRCVDRSRSTAIARRRPAAQRDASSRVSADMSHCSRLHIVVVGILWPGPNSDGYGAVGVTDG